MSFKNASKHLNRYVHEFTARHNMRELDTADQMSLIAHNLGGKRIRYQDLVAKEPEFSIPFT